MISNLKSNCHRLTAQDAFPHKATKNQREISNEENQREITTFIQVLVKYLHAKDLILYTEAKRVILSCLKKNQDNVQGYKSLSASLLSHLRKSVGGKLWKEAEVHYVRYLCKKQRLTVFEAEKIKEQVAIHAAIAYTDLLNKERETTVASNRSHHSQKQKRERQKQKHEKGGIGRALPLNLPSLSSSSVSPSHRQRLVKFGNVSIREYTVNAGDNPSCTSGALITLKRTYNPAEREMSVDEYEKYKTTRGAASLLSSSDRHSILTEHNTPIPEIIEAQKECLRVRKERREALNILMKKKQVYD